MHCDPHSTSANLAFQTISFPGGPSHSMGTIDGMQQYLTVMNSHPLLQTAISNQQLVTAQ